MTFCSQPKIRPASVLGGETTPSCFIAPVKAVHLWSSDPCFTAHVSRHSLAWEVFCISKGTPRPGHRFNQSREGER